MSSFIRKSKEEKKCKKNYKTLESKEIKEKNMYI